MLKSQAEFDREKEEKEALDNYQFYEGNYLIKVTIWECKDLLARYELYIRYA